MSRLGLAHRLTQRRPPRKLAVDVDRRTQEQLMRSLRRDADRICQRFALRYRSLDPERANVKSRYGICYDDGSIKIRLRHVSTGEPLKYSSLVNTLCHELAHLEHFNHGPHFQVFYARMLAWARQEGIYRPAPHGGERPRAAAPHASGPSRFLGAPSGRNAPTAPASVHGDPSTRRDADCSAADQARPEQPARRPLQLDLFA